MFNKRSVIGLFTDEDSVADALDKVSESGFSSAEYEILTGTPYPDGTFGDEEPKHKLYRFPIIGAMCGFIVGLLLTAGNQIAIPLITGGKPLVSIPPMLIIMYEGTMLGAILFTVFGIIFESRLPRLFMGAYDTKITEGYIGICITSTPEKMSAAEEVLKNNGAEEVKRGWE